MKNKIVLLIALIIIVISIIIIISIIIEQNKVGEFRVYDYQDYINDYQSGRIFREIPDIENLGEIPDAKTAKIKGIETLTQIYNKDSLNVSKKNKDYRVYFDSETQTWLVEGVLSSNWLKRLTFGMNLIGGTPAILIQKEDGKVLALWHTM